MAVHKKGTKWFNDWYDRNGKRHRRSHPTKAEAEKADRSIKDWKRHKGPLPKGYTLANLADQFLATKTGAAEQTRIGYGYTVREVVAAIGKKNPQDLSVQDLEPVRQWMKKYSPESRRTREACVRCFLKYCHTCGYVNAKPDELWPNGHYRQNHRTQLITHQDYLRLLAAATPLQTLVLILGYHCGMRRIEMARAIVADFDGNTQTLSIHTPKRALLRRNPIGDQPATFLRNITAGREPDAKLTSLVSDSGRPVGPNRLSGIFLDLCNDVGIRDIHCHDLRRTWASDLATVASLATIKDMGGWRNIKSIEPYLVSRAENRKGSAEALDAKRQAETTNLTTTGKVQ